jgi:hypothetical protein
MKTGFWLRGGNGKLAGATVYKDKSTGETIMREVVTPSNPKTEKQMIQRIIMHTAGQAYSKMKEICDHSFEGIKAGRDTMAYFMAQNIQFARNRIAAMQEQGVDFYDMYSFVPLKEKGFTPNQYQVSMGSLPRVNTDYVLDEPQALDYVTIKAITENTYEGVINALGLQRGDQLTFMIVDQTNGITAFGQNEFHYARVILDPINADGSSAPLSSAFVVDNAINLPSPRNEGDFQFSFSATDGLHYRARNAGMVCAAVIVSREVSGKWLRSTAYMTYAGSGEYSLGDCLDRASRGTANPIYTADEWYLNNAGVGGHDSETEAVTVNITSASADGQALVVGTPKNIAVSSFPHSADFVLNTDDVVEDGAFVVKNASGTVVGSFDNNDGILEATFNVASPGGTFTIYQGNSNTGYSVVYAIAGPDDGGGFGG